jgi:hypothetical protein
MPFERKRDRKIPIHLKFPRWRLRNSSGAEEQAKNSEPENHSGSEEFIVTVAVTFFISLAVYVGIELLEDILVEALLKARVEGVFEAIHPIAQYISFVEYGAALLIAYVVAPHILKK